MQIYKITNLFNNKSYIGQTKRSFKLRFKEHIESALYDKTKNTHLYKSIKKYGKQNFKIELLHECKNIEEMNKLERSCIIEHNTLHPVGYNYLLGGLNNYNLSEDHILKISKPIKAIDATTGKEYFFISLTVPSKNGFSAGSVSQAIKLKKQYKGYFWQHISNEEYLKNKEINDIQIKPLFYIENIKTKEITKVYKASDYLNLGLSRSKIGPCLKKYYGRKSHMGYTFSYDLPTDPAKSNMGQ